MISMVIRKFVIYIISSKYHGYYRAGGNGPAAPVLAGPVFSQGEKNKSPFLRKASDEEKCWCDFWTCWTCFIGL